MVTRECGIAPLLEDSAALVVSHDTDAVAGAIQRVLSEPGLHAKLSAGCREVVSRLGWEEPALAMESLYDEIVSAPSRVT